MFKLNLDDLQSFFSLIESGKSIKVAAALNRLNPNTVYRWINEGERNLLDNDDLDIPLNEFATFVTELRYRQAKFINNTMDYFKGIADTDPKLWNAYMAILEKQHPAEYGKQQKIEMEHSSKQTAKITIEVVNGEDYMRLRNGTIDDTLKLIAQDIIEYEDTGTQ